MKKAVFVLMSVLVSSCYANADKHIIGGTVGYGFQDFDSTNTRDSEPGDSFVGDLYYRYMQSEYFGAEAGFMSGTSGVVSAVSSVFSGIDNINYKGFRGTVYGQVPLSQSNHLYAKIGLSATQLEYDYSGAFHSQEIKSVKSRGNNFYGAIGWEFRFRSGIGINLEYQYSPVQALQVQSLNIGTSYQF